MKKNNLRISIVFIYCLIILFPIYGNNSITAKQQSQVISGNARFTVLTPQLIRLEWSDSGKFEDSATLTFINRNLETPDFKIKETSKELTLTTEKLTLKYAKDKRFSEETLSITFILNRKKVKWMPGMDNSENLKGTMRTLDRQDGWQAEKLEQGILSKAGWALIDDSNTPLLSADERWEYWVSQRENGNKTDWYFFGYGHEYKKALEDFTKVAGKIPMPPKFAFGYWWSRYWQYSDNELKDLVVTLKSLNIPLDVLIIDMDWHKTFGLTSHNTPKDDAGERKGWTGYSWDKNVFPKPELFFDWTGKEGLKTALNLHPASGIMPYEDIYDDFAEIYGWDTVGKKYIPFDMDNRKWANTYFDQIISPLEKKGVDFWWLDWQQYRESKRIKNLSNTFWLNHVFFTDMKQKGNDRPILFHRWGGLGNHRYQIGFSGDSYISWASLSFQPYFTATASNVGYGYWSHDIGGHYFKKDAKKETDPELYLRWLQYGVFSPIFRTHSTKDVDIERRIWKFPNHFEQMRDALHLRYKLAPYIYNASRQAYDSGVSICRPMYYEYPEMEYAYGCKNQYFFGDNILVAPVVSPADERSGLSTVECWLPEGDWYEMSTGTMLAGSEKPITRNFTLNEIPYYAKAGSIIPLNPGNVKNLQTPCDTLSLLFVPGAENTCVYYEDDGTSNSYENDFAKTNIRKEIKAGGKEVVITISERKGQYAGMTGERAYEIQLPLNFPPVSVSVAGKEIPFSHTLQPDSWIYDGFGLETRILTKKYPCNKDLVITIHYSEAQLTQKHLLDNKVKLFKRFVPVTESFKYLNTKYDQLHNLSTEYLGVSQIPSFISAEPEKTVEYLRYFEDNFENALKEIENFKYGEEREINKLLNIIQDK